MTLHPVPARWFEALVARDDTVAALETLARTRAVELEIRVDASTPQVLPDAERQLETYRRLARQCEVYWPPHRIRPSPLTASPSQTLRRAIEKLEKWCVEADPVLQVCERLKAERADLLLWLELLTALHGVEVNFEALAAGGPTLNRAVFVLPAGVRLERPPGEAIVHAVRTEGHAFLITLGSGPDVQSLDQRVMAAGGRRLLLPPWLAASVRESARRVEERLKKIADEVSTEDRALALLQDEYALREVLGDILLLDWFVRQMRACPGSETFCWLTGWTSDLGGKTLGRALRDSGIRAVVRIAEPPEGAKPPLVMSNPWWVRAFELFPKLMGMPAAHEIDPTALLGVVVPLLFGYMFGDIGHGLVIAAAGLALVHRWPDAAILVPCGLSATLFGWLFGSVFGLEDIVEPLWIQPLAQPLLVLGVPLLGGAILMVLGLLLGGVEAHWRGKLVEWGLVDAAVMVIYLGALMAIEYPGALAVALVGLLWYLAGNLRLQSGNRLGVVLGALGRLAESGMQLGVNTLSFARVGAFALAHAGLSVAMVALAKTGGGPVGRWVVLIFGNALIIALEALVVSIQTARLILFEFFIRFLRAEGRVFRPIAAPPAVQGDLHGSKT